MAELVFLRWETQTSGSYPCFDNDLCNDLLYFRGLLLELFLGFDLKTSKDSTTFIIEQVFSLLKEQR